MAFATSPPCWRDATTAPVWVIVFGWLLLRQRVGRETLALLVLLPFRRWRRVLKGRLLMLLLGLASLGTAAALTGCGGGFALPLTSQSYTLTVTGTAGSDTHSTTVQLTVQ